MHVTVSHLKAMIRLLPGDPLWGELCMTVSNLTICLFRAFWSHFNDVSKCFMDKYRIRMKILSTYALNLCLCNWDPVVAASSSHLSSPFLSIEKSFILPTKKHLIPRTFSPLFTASCNKDNFFKFSLLYPSHVWKEIKHLGGNFVTTDIPLWHHKDVISTSVCWTKLN